MSQPLVLTGANIILWVNNIQYNEVQSISFTIDYAEEGIFGIDSPYPQEIAGSKVMVKGTVSGIRIINSGGLQGKNLRPKFSDSASSPYVSIRIQDRQSKEDIIFISQAKVARETHTAVTGQSYKLNFDFVGQQPLMALDRI